MTSPDPTRLDFSRRETLRLAHTWVGRVAAAVAAVLLPAIAAGQTCHGQWLPSGDALGTTNGPVNVVMHWDPDGTGPQSQLVVLGGTFGAAGTTSANNVATWDGTNWGTLGSGVNGTVNTMAVLADGEVVVGGHFSRAGSVDANNIARWNGTSWAALGQGTNFQVFALKVLASGDLIVGGQFTTAGGASANHVARWNGAAWSALGSGTATETNYSGFVYSLAEMPDGAIVAGGEFLHAGGVVVGNIASWDGSVWTGLGTGTGTGPITSTALGDVTALIVMPSGALVAGGTFHRAGSVLASHIASWDGTAWSPLGAGLQYHDASNDHWGVTSLLVLASGDLVVTGGFDESGTQSIESIARWDGTNWWAEGDLFNSLSVVEQPDGDLVVGRGGLPYANHLAVWDGTSWDMVGSNATAFGDVVGRLAALPDGGCVAGGAFTRAGGNPANFLARWNGSSWSEFAGGLTPIAPNNVASVSALTVTHDGGLIVGGAFSGAGGVPVVNIARWDGTQWSGMGSAFSTGVSATAELSNGDIAAAGIFNGSTTPVMRWDGSSWSAIGSGLSGQVRALVVLNNGDLVAGGSFVNGNLNYVARWNGAAWVALGGGTDGVVRALAVLADGSLAAAGEFGTAGGVLVHKIARWDGSVWGPLGAGLSDTVNALAAGPDGSVVASGVFLQAGGAPAVRIARWDGTAWTPLGSGLDVQAGTLAVLVNGDVCAGGTFTTAGGLPSSFFARFAQPSADYNHDGDTGTDADIEAFFACLSGNCCQLCASADFNGDGDVGTDADIESFFRVLGGAGC